MGNSAGLGLKPLEAYAVSHPLGSTLEPTNKAIPLLAVIVAKRQPVVESQGQKYRPSAWRYLLACPSYRRRPTQAPQNFARSPGGQPLKECRPIRSRTAHRIAHTSLVKIIWFEFCCISQFLSPFRSFHHVVR